MTSKTMSRRSLAKTLIAGSAAVGFPGFAVGADAQGSELQIGSWAEVHPGVWKVTVGTPAPFTAVSSRLVPPKVEAFMALPAAGPTPKMPVSAIRSARGCTVKLPLKPSEQIFGFGLQLLSFAQRGTKKTIRVNADPKMDTGDSHAPVPFYVSTEGYGVLVDTVRYVSFYVGSAHPKPTHAMTASDDHGVDPKYENTEVAREDFVMIDVPAAAGVDIYFFAGPEMLDAVRRYNVFSGGGVEPPEWGLGFWFRMMAKDTQEDVLTLAREFRDRKIPCDVIGLEPGWQSHSYSCSFVWDQGRYPDPKKFLASAQEQNFRINLWEHAYTHPTSPLFPALEPHSGDLGVWGGLVPDFAGQPARDAFGDFHGRTLIEAGISGFKLDECDNSDFTHNWSFPESSFFPSGIDGEQMHSVFGLRYQMAIWDAFRRRGHETYGMVRSSGALAAPYPFVLYSDLYDHRDYIRALANSGFSGLLWCPEVRQADSQEDLIRRLQSVVFSPLTQVDCWYMKNPPWKQTNRNLNNANHFFDDWEQLEARCKEIIGWRMRLVPYLQAAFQRYADDGTPPFRALVLDSPKDKRLYKVDDQYLVGDRLMVAPLFAGEKNRKVLFPEGKWRDFWTGDLVPSGGEMTVPSTTDNIPVYIKDGSLMPWADVGQHVGTPETRQLSVRVYGDGARPFAMRTAGGTLSLSWSHKAGMVKGNGGYTVHSWEVIG